MTVTSKQYVGKVTLGYVKPDGWTIGGELYIDFSLPERYSLRLQTHNGGPIKSLAVQIEVTGRKFDREDFIRCRITFLGDGEQDVTSGGKVLFRQTRPEPEPQSPVDHRGLPTWGCE